jgi:hypothetical protein
MLIEDRIEVVAGKIAKYIFCATIATAPLWGILLLAYLLDWLLG